MLLLFGRACAKLIMSLPLYTRAEKGITRRTRERSTSFRPQARTFATRCAALLLDRQTKADGIGARWRWRHSAYGTHTDRVCIIQMRQTPHEYVYRACASVHARASDCTGVCVLKFLSVCCAAFEDKDQVFECARPAVWPPRRSSSSRRKALSVI